jgi:hypothetical protein
MVTRGTQVFISRKNDKRGIAMMALPNPDKPWTKPAAITIPIIK